MLTKTILAAVDWGQYNMEDSIKELSALCEAANMEVVGTVIQNKDHPEGKYYLWRANWNLQNRLPLKTGRNFAFLTAN